MSIVGVQRWEQYWSLCDNLVAEMKQCQNVADKLRVEIALSLSAPGK